MLLAYSLLTYCSVLDSRSLKDDLMLFGFYWYNEPKLIELTSYV